MAYWLQAFMAKVLLLWLKNVSLDGSRIASLDGCSHEPPWVKQVFMAGIEFDMNAW